MSFTTYRNIKSSASDTEKSDCNNLKETTMAEEQKMNQILEELLKQNESITKRLSMLETKLIEPRASTSKTAYSRSINDIDEIRDISEDESSASSQRTMSMRRLKEELALIIEFDGHNISVETFISEIKSIIHTINSNNHPRLIRLIITQKIVREA